MPKRWVRMIAVVTVVLGSTGISRAAAIEETGKLQQIGGDFKKPGLLGVLYEVKFLSDTNELGADNICAQFKKNASYVCPTQQD